MTDSARRFLQRLRTRLERSHPSIGWAVVDRNGAENGNVATASPTFFQAIDVYLQPDANERATNLRRAAAMRVPAVAVRTTTSESVVVDFETGRLAELDQLGDCLVDVLDDPKRAADMGLRARARAERRFDRVHIDEQILRIYDRVLSRVMTS
jgi:glycosyltransferase involved in cell wall biosynthesis